MYCGLNRPYLLGSQLYLRRSASPASQADMKKPRYTAEMISQILKEAEQEENVRSVCRRYGIPEPTFYRWRQRYGDAQERRLRELEYENGELKKLVAELTLDNRVLREGKARDK